MKLSHICLGLLVVSLPGAVLGAGGRTASPLIPFHYVQGHFLVVPVRVNDAVDTLFVLDTGIGVNVISKRLAERLGCRIDGTYTGKRMSGQDIRCAMTRLDALAVGPLRKPSVPCGVFDFDAHGFGVDPSVTGFVGLEFFRDRPFTVDYRSRRIYLEDERSLARRRARGTVVPIRIHDRGPDVTIFGLLRVAGAHDAWVEIDTGSPSLTLDERYLSRLGLSRSSDRVRRVAGSDETGFSFVRHFAKDNIPVHFAAHPGPDVGVRTMFQNIIYDGLIGHSLLRNHVVTYDLPRSALVLARSGW